MKSTETYSEWIAQLKEQAKHCCFFNAEIKNEQQAIDDRIVDQVVMRTPHEFVRNSLLQKENPTIDELMRICNTYEMLQNVKEDLSVGKPDQIEHTIKTEIEQVDKIGESRTRTLHPFPRSQQDNRRATCQRCGRNHNREQQCPASGKQCFRCRRYGHFQRFCRMTGRVNEVRESHTGDTEEDIIRSIDVIAAGQKIPLVAVKINQKEVLMEYDTGATVSVIPKQLWLDVGKPMLRTTKRLRTYDRRALEALGSRTVAVELGRLRQKLEATVVETESVPLFGRPWIDGFLLKWPKEVIWQERFHMQCPTLQIVPIGDIEQDMEKILARYNALFVPGTGCVKDYEIDLVMDPKATPRRCPSRRVPFALRSTVEEEIQRQVNCGILEPVDHSNSRIDWATPIVTVRKQSGGIRLCGDFRVTINPFLQVESYVIPTWEEITASIAGGHQYTILDLKDAYLQLKVRTTSRKYLTLATPTGYYQYTRLPFGISAAPTIFQRYMDQLLKGIPMVAAYLDDIIVTGRSEKEHMMHLNEVLSRLSKAGIKLKREKCQFMQDRVEFLGHVIYRDTIMPSETKVAAIRMCPTPRSKTELRTFLGRVNYLSKFTPELQAKCADLYQLCGKNNIWKWTAEHDKAFEVVKEAMLDARVLQPFNIAAEVHIASDASESGLGAVMFQKATNGKMMPVVFASRILKDYEKNYAQIEKEALSIIYAVRKFHQYVWTKIYAME